MGPLARQESDLLAAIEDLERDRGINKDTLLEAVEQALVSAYRRKSASEEDVVARIDRETGAPQLFVRRTVVDEVENAQQEVSLTEARAISPGKSVGDVLETPIAVADLGRIAAQTAKQVVVQRIREAERTMVYEEFIGREGDIVAGTVERQQGRNIYIDLGKTEALLLSSEQIPGEVYRQGQRLKVYIVEVKMTTKGPQIMVSRTNPGMLKRLFELEIPEVHEGVVEIRGIAREAGARSKVAVAARVEDIDPVGACVGPKHMRISNILAELQGEKVDVIEWSADPGQFVANALRPAKASQVIADEEHHSARVIVPDYQLSLAIGKAGQNARLAAKLTGWRIDIRSESQVAEQQGPAASASPGPTFTAAPETGDGGDAMGDGGDAMGEGGEGGEAKGDGVAEANEPGDSKGA